MEILLSGWDLLIHLDVHLAVLLQQYGAWVYLILFVIIFCETGLVVTPFLPGDSLLFVAGALAAAGGLDVHLLALVLVVAAVLGNTVNYSIGYYLGPKVFHWEGTRFFNRKALDRAHAFDVGKDASLTEAARNRLQLLGMSEEQIGLLEKTGQPQTRITLYAPINGVIAELGVREGMTVMSGAMLFRLVDLSSVWVNAEVPEAQGAWLRPGTAVEARVPSFPGQVFRGRVSAILPEVNAATRTLRARVELANPGGRLKPGMFATLVFAQSTGAKALLVPSEAVIRTGERSIVVVAESEGKFRPREVELGFESGGKSEIRKGLSEGDKVVVSGQFLIDSEASLRATGTRMEGAEMSKATAPKTHHAVGEIVHLGASELLIKHGAIPSAGMGAMTMPFDAPKSVVPPGLKKGDRIRFEFIMQSDGQLRITNIAPADASMPERGARK